MKDRLRRYFKYLRDGSFLRIQRSGSALVGVVTKGTLHHSGYRRIRFLGKAYNFHRLVWFWHYGVTNSHIDHRNGKRGDNRIENLRLATPAQNAWNQPKLKRNTTGVKGLFWDSRDRLWYGSVKAGKTRKKVCGKRRIDVIHKLCALRRRLHGDFAKS